MRHPFFIHDSFSNTSGSQVAFSDFSADFFFKKVITESPQEVSFFISSDRFNEWKVLAVKLHKHFREVKIHAYTNTCLFEEISPLLSKGILESCSFGVDKNKFFQLSHDEAVILFYLKQKKYKIY